MKQIHLAWDDEKSGLKFEGGVTVKEAICHLAAAIDALASRLKDPDGENGKRKGRIVVPRPGMRLN